MSNNQSDVELNFDTLQIKKAALVIRAVNHKLRQQILSLLAENNTMMVTAIFEKLNLEQPVASQHLSILRKAGFVITERQGKFIFYSVNHERLNEGQNYGEMLLNSAK